ncbi:hypothetical protein EMIT047CA2_60289 [Pseudomonas soli]
MSWRILRAATRCPALQGLRRTLGGPDAVNNLCAQKTLKRLVARVMYNEVEVSSHS